MASVNKAIILGFLGQDPETRYSADGSAITTISVATSDKYKDKSTGETKETTEWHRIKFFGKLADIVGEYLKKGSAIYVEGKLRTSKWTDKQGIERYTTEIIADSMQMLGGRDGSSNSDSDDGFSTAPPQKAASQSANKASAKSAAAPQASFDNMDDDIPF